MPLIDQVGFEPTQAFYCLQILSLFRLNQGCGTDRIAGEARIKCERLNSQLSPEIF